MTSERVEGGAYAPFARAICAGRGCDRLISVRVKSNEGNNPECIQKKFRAEGWEFNAWNAGETRCPECQRKRAEARRGESPKGVQMNSGHTPGPTNVRPISSAPAARPILSAAAPPEKTELTPDDKTRVRTIIGGTFDEKAGRYLDNYSDARVATECGLPLKLVRDYRDTAFGPLKSVPELDAIRAEIEALATQAKACVTTANEIDGKASALRRRADDLATKLGVAA